MPFGGVGASGFGKYHGPAGFEICSHLKSCQVKYPTNMFPFNQRYPPYTDNKHKLLRIL